MHKTREPFRCIANSPNDLTPLLQFGIINDLSQNIGFCSVAHIGSRYLLFPKMSNRHHEWWRTAAVHIVFLTVYFTEAHLVHLSAPLSVPRVNRIAQLNYHFIFLTLVFCVPATLPILPNTFNLSCSLSLFHFQTFSNPSSSPRFLASFAVSWILRRMRVPFYVAYGKVSANVHQSNRLIRNSRFLWLTCQWFLLGSFLCAQYHFHLVQQFARVMLILFRQKSQSHLG